MGDPELPELSFRKTPANRSPAKNLAILLRI